jgi:hypothetical protein
MAIKYTKRAVRYSKGHKIYQHFPLLVPPKFTQIGIFGLKIKPSGKPCSRIDDRGFKSAPGIAVFIICVSSIAMQYYFTFFVGWNTWSQSYDLELNRQRC